MDGVTRRVLELSATGLVTTEVAAELDMTVEDVRASLAAAGAELGARSKLEAVIIAIREGLIRV